MLVAATDTLLDFELAAPLRFAPDRLATAPHPPMIKPRISDTTLDGP